MIDARVARGTILPVHRGVYRPAARPLTDHGRVLAACLAGGDDALASHRSAGWLWGLVEDLLATEVTVPHSRSARLAGVTTHRVRALPPAPSIRAGIPVTNPLRTLVDLAGVVPPTALTLAFDRGVAARLFTPEAVAAERARSAAHGRAGLRAVDAVLAAAGPVSARSPSVLQNAMARLLRRAGLPLPVPEYEVLGGRYRLDFAYPPPVWLALEVDGWDVHRTPAQVQRDHARRRQLVELGWALLVFMWDDVVRRPAAVAAEVARHLMSRASRPA